MKNIENLSRKSFTSDDNQNDFFEKGYVIVRNCIDEEALDLLGHFFMENINHYASRYFISTIELKDIEHRRKTNLLFKTATSALADKYLLNYNQFYGGFGVKFPTGDISTLDVHQDTTMLSYEANRTALTIWIPLIDVNENSGCLFVISGSHKYNRQPRPTGTPFPYKKYKDLLAKEFLTPVPMNRGDIIIMDQSLIHSSAPNSSDTIRVAAMGMYKPMEDELVYYNYLKESNSIDVYKVADGFYLTHNLGETPQLSGAKNIPFNDNPYVWF